VQIVIHSYVPSLLVSSILNRAFKTTLSHYRHKLHLREENLRGRLLPKSKIMSQLLSFSAACFALSHKPSKLVMLLPSRPIMSSLALPFLRLHRGQTVRAL
jgi:hypothetical protein